MRTLLAVLVCLSGTPVYCQIALPSHAYCIVGAGPAGLQLAYFLGQAQRDYVILERAFVPASAFHSYPRHRRLLSINKRHTGREASSAGGRDYSLRHDWHSFITDPNDVSFPPFSAFSDELYPSADDYVSYVDAFVQHTSPDILFGHEVVGMQSTGRGPATAYHLAVRRKNAADSSSEDALTINCEQVIMATGLSQEYVPDLVGIELTESYGDYDIDPKRFTNKTVAVLGSGNSAFEVMSSIMGETAYVHMHSTAQELKLAWETHYVGDIRSINTLALDNHQLKSQDIFYIPSPLTLTKVSSMIRVEENAEGQRVVCLVAKNHDQLVARSRTAQGLRVFSDHSLNFRDRLNSADRFCYHHIIRATGMQFDKSPLTGLAKKLRTVEGKEGTKFPLIRPTFEASGHHNLFFVGANAHSLDYKQSSGGFLHGFRYLAKSLFGMLEQRNHEVAWPHTRLALGPELQRKLTYRMDTSSALYQMFEYLCDVVVIRSREGNGIVDYYYDVPLNLVATAVGLKNKANNIEYLTLSFDYGPEFHGHDRVWAAKRSMHNFDPAKAHTSQFLHPVLRYHNPSAPGVFTHIPYDTQKQWARKDNSRPTAEHHTLESLVTDFKIPELHTNPLRQFLLKIETGPLLRPNKELFKGFGQEPKLESKGGGKTPKGKHDEL